MTDEKLIAEMRHAGSVLRGRPGDIEAELGGWLLKEAADRLEDRLEGRPAAQATEDSHD